MMYKDCNFLEQILKQWFTFHSCLHRGVDAEHYIQNDLRKPLPLPKDSTRVWPVCACWGCASEADHAICWNNCDLWTWITNIPRWITISTATHKTDIPKAWFAIANSINLIFTYIFHLSKKIMFFINT